MFPLSTKIFPSTATELARLINDSLGRLFVGPVAPVFLRADAYPEIAELRLSLDAAKLRAHLSRPPVLPVATTPALTLKSFHVQGAGIIVGPIAFDLKLTGRDIRLAQARDAQEEIVLTLQSVAEGEVEISAGKNALENAIAELAKHEASKHGVTIEDVQLTWRSRGSRGLDAEVQLRAKKLFFTTAIQVTAKLDLDEQLTASISDVSCHGEGTIGSMACGFLAPHLQKVDGRSFPLMALELGRARLCDVRVSAGEALTVSAKLGA